MEAFGTMFVYDRCSKNVLSEMILIIDSILCSEFLN